MPQLNIAVRFLFKNSIFPSVTPAGGRIIRGAPDPTRGGAARPLRPLPRAHAHRRQGVDGEVALVREGRTSHYLYINT